MSNGLLYFVVRLSVSRIKMSLHPSMYKVKNIAKRWALRPKKIDHLQLKSSMDDHEPKNFNKLYCSYHPTSPPGSLSFQSLGNGWKPPIVCFVKRYCELVTYCYYRCLLSLHRIKAQYEQLVGSEMSERNAKHNFIDYCQAMPGYGCRFYKLKARTIQSVPAF